MCERGHVYVSPVESSHTIFTLLGVYGLVSEESYGSPVALVSGCCVPYGNCCSNERGWYVYGVTVAPLGIT